MGDIGIGVVGGLIATAAWTAIVVVAWRVRRWWRYHNLSGDFEARMKATDWIDWKIRIKVRGNRLEVNAVDPHDRTRTFRGEIAMSDDVARSGRGYYVRNDESDAYGFYDIRVTDDDTILVIETWPKSDDGERRPVVSGYLWERTSGIGT